MAGKRLEYQIGVDPSKGIAGLKQFSGAAKKAMKDVDDSMDDTTTSAQKVANALSGLADELETEMKGAAQAADALGEALGPELAGRADLGAVVADLHKMGLSFEEITADADALAGSLKKLDAVQLSGAAGDLDRFEKSSRHAKDNLDDLGRSADSSKSVLANMVGNTTQDLGALGGIAGSAGVAIGQIGEYASDALAGTDNLGQVLKNFGAIVGPLGALTLVTIGLQAIKSNMDDVAETKAFEEERVKAFADALADASVTAAELAKVLTVEGETGIFVRIENETVNVQRAVESTLGTFEAFNAKVQQGTKGFDDYSASLIASAEAAGLSQIEMLNLRTALDDASDGTLDNRVAWGQVGEEWRNGIETATALGAAVTGIDVANQKAATTATFWGRAVAESGGDADLAAKRTADLNEQLRQYIVQTGNVPTAIVSQISAEIDEGSLNEAEQQLKILSRNRTMELSVIAAGGAGFGPGPKAKGGRVGAEGGIAGEAGPEFIQLPDGKRSLLTAATYVPPGTRVTSTRKTARILRTRVTRGLRKYDSGGTVPAVSTTNVNLHLPAGSNGADVVRQVNRWQRRNGASA